MTTYPVSRTQDTPKDTSHALAVLREAIEGHSREDRSLEHLRVLVLGVCANARLEGVSHEHVLIRLKAVLDGLPSADAETKTLQTSVRAHLMAFAVDAYFAHGA